MARDTDKHKPITQQQDEILKGIYYDEKAFVGRDALYRLVKEKYPNLSIPRRVVLAWLKTQENYQLYRIPRATTTTKPILATKKRTMLQMDLIDFQRFEYRRFKYILTVIDLYSRKAWTFPLKNKTPREIHQVFEPLVSSIQPSAIQTDNGGEFSRLNTILPSSTKHFTTQSHTPQSNGVIERFNGTLKRMLFKYMKAYSSNDWVSVLDEITQNYNNMYHNSTEMTPQTADSLSNQDEKELGDKLRAKKKKQYPKIEEEVLEEGDSVRLKNLNRTTKEEIYY